MLNICILGANGQVGSQLVALCCARGINHVSLTRQVLDITDQYAVDKYFRLHHDFDFVINAAAYTNVDGAEREHHVADAVNHLAVVDVAKVCQQYGMPLIHLSTDYVFDGTQQHGYQASDVTSPIGAYGKSKLQGERAVQTLCKQHIILRLSWVYSTVGHNFLKTMLRLMQEKSHIRVVADQYGAPTSAASIARVIVAICEYQQHQVTTAHQRWGIYHYSDAPVTTWYDYASYIHAQAMAMSFPVVTQAMVAIASDAYVSLAKRPQYSVFCMDKIMATFGIKPACWQHEVREVLRGLQPCDSKINH